LMHLLIWAMRIICLICMVRMFIILWRCWVGV